MFLSLLRQPFPLLALIQIMLMLPYLFLMFPCNFPRMPQQLLQVPMRNNNFPHPSILNPARQVLNATIDRSHFGRKQMIIDFLYKLDVILIGLSVLMMRTDMNEEYIYKLKVIVLGDKGVGKSTIIHTYLQGRGPKSLPPNEDISFHLKKEEYVSINNNRRSQHHRTSEGNERDSPIYECHLHLWDISGSVCNKQTLLKFKKERFYDNTAAIMFVFKDEQSFKFLKEKVVPNLPRLEINNKQDQFLIYNAFKADFNRKLQEEAQSYAPKEMIYMRLQFMQIKNVKEIFSSLIQHSMFKIEDGVLTNAVLKDRNNNIILKDYRVQNSEFTRRYNRCC